MERLHVCYRRRFHFVPEIDAEEAIAPEEGESGIDIPRARSRCTAKDSGAPSQPCPQPNLVLNAPPARVPGTGYPNRA
jgi:hypothetical protein